MRHSLLEGQSLLKRAQVGPEDRLHDVPGCSGALGNNLEHGVQAPLVVEQYLVSPRRSSRDSRSMARIGLPGIQAGDALQRIEIGAEMIMAFSRIGNEGADAGQHVVA